LLEESKELISDESEEKIFTASQWQLIWWKFLRHRIAVTSLIILLILYIFAIFAEFISPYNPSKEDVLYTYCPPARIHFIDESGKFHLRPFVYKVEKIFDSETLSESYKEERTEKYFIKFWVRGEPYKLWNIFPSNIHLFGVEGEGKLFLFGTDKMGRDLFSRIIHGSRISLSIGLIGVAISFILGIFIGGISGYFGGTTDVIIQRIIEFLISIPTLPLWMALSVALPPQWPVLKVYFGITIILSLLGWPGLARVIRGKFMALKEEDFVMAARLAGASELRIIFRHLLPSFYSHIIASITLSIPGMILGETSLSFLGLGLQPPAISWGVLLKDAQSIQSLANCPWLLIPGAFIAITVLSFNFLGDGLRDAADPYSK